MSLILPQRGRIRQAAAGGDALTASMLSTLFGAGQGGIAFDFTDASRLFTDAGTTNVTADNDLVYRALPVDNGWAEYGEQTNSGYRPKWNTGGYLLFNDSIDFMEITALLDLSATKTASSALRFTKGSDGAQDQTILYWGAHDKGDSFMTVKIGANRRKLSTGVGAGQGYGTTYTWVCISDTTSGTELHEIFEDGTSKDTLSLTADVGVDVDNAYKRINRDAVITSWSQGKLYRCIYSDAAWSASERAVAEEWVEASLI